MFDSITDETISKLSARTRDAILSLKEEEKSGNLNIIKAIDCFSNISIQLSMRSLQDRKRTAEARPLYEIYKKILNSEYATPELKKKMKRIISETITDFQFACGNQALASIRLSSFLNKRGKNG